MWHWTAAHPEWDPGEDWAQREVSSYAIEVGERLLLFDPLAGPAELEELTAGRETAIVLTSPWHRRDAIALAARLGAPIYVPPPDPPDPEPVPGQVFRAGERLPVGVEAFPGREENDVVLWAESCGAVVAGDTLIDRGHGLEIYDAWLPEGATHEDVAAGLRPLLDRSVEVVLATHGGPHDAAALKRALA